MLLTNGGPGTATLVPGLDMYQSAFQNDQYGYGMAIGTLLFIVMLAFTLTVMRALRPRTGSPASSTSKFSHISLSQISAGGGKCTEFP